MGFRAKTCLDCLQASRHVAISRPLKNHHTARYASEIAVTPAPSIGLTANSISTLLMYPPGQPPSHRRPEDRRSQLHRQYTSLLRSTPMMLLFQHNNLKATEWMSLRRELLAALSRVDSTTAGKDLAGAVRIQVIRGGVFGAALRIVEYYRPDTLALQHSAHPGTHTHLHNQNAITPAVSSAYTHALSRVAYEAAIDTRLEHEMMPLLSGPLAVVTFPDVSTERLKAALSVLSPKGPSFAAPTRRNNPSYWDPTVQTAVKKLMLLGARVEGTIFDIDGARWVGAIEGGIDGLRSQLVGIIQSAAGGIANSLEVAGKSLYLTMEARRGMLDQKAQEE